MEIISTQKFIRMTPRKLRLVAEYAVKLNPIDALSYLPMSHKRGAMPIAKVIKTAVANASVLGISQNDLMFKEIQIGEGPRLKRGRARSKGMYSPMKKRMSHIRVVLVTKPLKEVKVEKVLEEKKENTVKAKVVQEKETKKGKNGTKS